MAFLSTQVSNFEQKFYTEIQMNKEPNPKIQSANLSKVFKYFVPKEKKFYTLFNQAAICCIDASVELNNLMNSESEEKRKEIQLRIKIIERKGDEISNQVFDYLHHTFITPFDREDIHELANTLDDVVDLIYGISWKIESYRLTRFSKNMKDMVAEIHNCCSKIQTAVHGLENLRSIDNTINACNVLNNVESRVDQIFHLGISDLFDIENDAIELIKQKDILINIEKVADKIKDVSDIVKTILVKNA